MNDTGKIECSKCGEPYAITLLDYAKHEKGRPFLCCECKKKRSSISGNSIASRINGEGKWENWT